ncbi:MAG: dTDP-4-dehydrorhamnose 3,5-epimerase [Armatimonadaceae bacterium]
MGLIVEQTPLEGVLLLIPQVFGDSRGFFLESWNRASFREATGLDPEFVQDNHSRSGRHVLRGLHYQSEHAQGKLVRVTRGSVYDVVVDIRAGSSTFGRWYGTVLSEDNHRMLWVPPGFAHGFVVLSEYADFLYKVTDYRYPEFERTILWNDPAIGIEWPLEGAEPVLSARDAVAEPLSALAPFAG